MTTKPYFNKFSIPDQNTDMYETPLVFCLCCGGIIGPAICSKPCLFLLQENKDKVDGVDGEWLNSMDSSENEEVDNDDDSDYRPQTQEEDDDDYELSSDDE